MSGTTSRIRSNVDALNIISADAPLVEGDGVGIGAANAAGAARLQLTRTVSEVPAGVQDGVNAVFTTTFSYIPGTLRCFFRLAAQAATDPGYRELATGGVGAAGDQVAETDPALGTLTVGTPPQAADVQWVRYERALS